MLEIFFELGNSFWGGLGLISYSLVASLISYKKNKKNNKINRYIFWCGVTSILSALVLFFTDNLIIVRFSTGISLIIFLYLIFKIILIEKK